MSTTIEKRFQVSPDDGSSWIIVTPDNGSKIRLRDQRDLKSGQIFARRKLTGNPVLSADDYLYLWNFERDPLRRCQRLLIRVEQKCSGSFREVWRGQFSAGSCDWDLDACRVTLRTEPYDRYTCMLENMEECKNILQVAPVDATASITPSLEWTACILFASFGPDPAPVYCAQEIDEAQWWSVSGETPFTLGLCEIGGFDVDFMTIFWREVITTECVAGAAVTPPGTGWVLIENNCATTGLAKWVREPTISYTYGDPVGGSCVDGVAVPPATACDGQWIQLTPCDLVPESICEVVYPPYFICYAPTSIEVNRSRLLQDVFGYLIEQTGCSDLVGVRSDLFEWDPVGDAPGYAPGVNYVTGTANQHAHLLIVQKSDVMDPDASNPATIGETTLRDLLAILLITHQVFWDIDLQGYLRIEHWKYWQSQPGIDVSALAGAIEPLRYKHLNEENPRIERCKWMEALTRDFIGRDIIYSGACAGTKVEDYEPSEITTDVGFVLGDPTAIQKRGFVILSTVYDGSAYNTIIDLGAITGNALANAPMSWANLHRDFWTWNRYLPSGNMNGQDVVFDGFRPNIEQDEVSIPMCCGLSSFDAREYLNTKLGERLGILRGEVMSADHDLKTGRTTFVVRYAY